MKIAWLALVAVFLYGQSTGGALIVNPGKAKWTRQAGDPPGSESVVVREDARTGGLELLVSYPGGYVFPPHSHQSNERILLIEGKLALGPGSVVQSLEGQGNVQRFLEPGGYAFLPAREVQRLSCVSRKRCRFYVAWDGDPRSRPEAK